MKEVAIVREVFRNTPHVLVFRENNATEVKSLTSYGEEIIKEISNIAEIGQDVLPDGFIFTGFKPISPLMEKIIGNSASDGLSIKSLDSKSAEINNNLKTRAFSGREILQKSADSGRLSKKNSSKKQDVAAKIKAIDYRAQRFKSISVISSVASSVKHGKVGFDEISGSFVPRKNNVISEVVAEKAEKLVGHGKMRRMYGQEREQAVQSRSRRARRRARNLSPEVSEEKTALTAPQRLTQSIKARFRRHG